MRPSLGFARFFRLCMLICTLLAARIAFADACPAPEKLGPSPTRLILVVPATTQSADEWASFLNALKKEPRSADIAWLVYRHDVGYTTTGQAREIALAIASCIDQKVRANGYHTVTLIGHSIGGMLVRNAYLIGSGAMPETQSISSPWTQKVDKILLFSSVNKGVSGDSFGWWFGPATWIGRTFPHPHLVVEDFVAGSDFIADTRIAWIRYFGSMQTRSALDTSFRIPQVVQFWGTRDSVVNEHDNADLAAFSGPVLIRIPGATHRNLQRLEPTYVSDGVGRWAMFKEQLFNDASVPRMSYPSRRVLIIARGIRDSTNSSWVTDLVQRAEALRIYGEKNVIAIEYGYFSAAHFALRPLRRKPIPSFRDLYAQLLAENPNTTFDFIGHSNGTYILGQSLLSTPSMRFKNIVLAAPVLPVDFDWNSIFRRGQVSALRYDVAADDWAVGILCPALRALGFHDVGPGGVLLFGASNSLIAGPHIVRVGWYPGGHGESLRVDQSEHVDNLAHLLDFAQTGVDTTAGEPTRRELGEMRLLANLTPFIVWILVGGAVVLVGFEVVRGQARCKTWLLWTAFTLLVIYIVLDVT